MTTTSDITQIDLNYAAACEAITKVFPHGTVSVSQTVPYRFSRWTVTAISDNHGKHSGSAETFNEALDRCLASIGNACPVCGGHHSH